MRRVYYGFKGEYSTFESAYINEKEYLSVKPIRCYTESKQNSLFAWGSMRDTIRLVGQKDGVNTLIVAKTTLLDVYVLILKRADELFESFDKLKLNNGGDFLSINIDDLDIIFDVLSTLDRYDEKTLLDVNSKLILRSKVSIDDRIEEAITFKPPLLSKREILNKKFWIEIRLQTSIIANATESGDYKSTLGLYNKYKNLYPNKQISIVRAENGVPVDCFIKEKEVQKGSIFYILEQYKIILKCLKNIREVMGGVTEEVDIKNKTENIKSHILENTSFYNEETFKEFIISEKCSRDDRRELKAISEIAHILPNDIDISNTIITCLEKSQLRLNKYYNGGEDYLEGTKHLNKIKYKEITEVIPIIKENKNKYFMVKESVINKEICCFRKK